MQPDKTQQPDQTTQDLLPISMVAEIAYCPRNFYYRMVEGETRTDHRMLQGRLDEEKRKERLTLHREHYTQKRSVRVASDTLGITGVVDVLESGRKIYPVEFKIGKAPSKPRLDGPEAVQLCAQAMALSEMLDIAIPQGYIYYSDSKRRVKVVFDDALKQKVRQCIDIARSILDKSLFPDPVNDERCVGCSLAEICLPEETLILRTQKPQTPHRPLPGLGPMRTVYIDEHGSYVRQSGEKIIITAPQKDSAGNTKARSQAKNSKSGKPKSEILAEVPLSNIDAIVVAGNTIFSSYALKTLMRRGVDISYVSTSGRFIGKFTSQVSKNSVARLAQYRAHNDPNFCLAVSKEFVAAKLANERTLLLRANRSIRSEKVANAATEIKKIINLARTAQSKETLLGLEGLGTRHYFSALPLILKGNIEFDFTKRTRRPPKDPVNALLSLAYAILTSDVISVIHTVGLDPYVGFFHTAKYAKPCLALDIVEEFRPLVADSVVITVVNKAQLTPDDFETSGPNCFLKDHARKRFYVAYSQRKAEHITHPIFKYRLPYARTIELQVRFLAKVLTGDLPRYIGFTTR